MNDPIVKQPSRPIQRVKIYTSYYANYKNICPGFQCLSISNTKPSSIFIPRLREAAPHWSIVKDYKEKKISRDFFGQMYMQQIHQHIGPYNLRDYIISLNNTDVVLLCYEKQPETCHRSILADYIKMLIPEFDVVGELA